MRKKSYTKGDYEKEIKDFELLNGSSIAYIWNGVPVLR